MAKKGKKQRDPASGDVATNRRARHKFPLLEKMIESNLLRDPVDRFHEPRCP